MVKHPRPTANSPEVYETISVGQIFNAQRDGDRLRVELWIDRGKARRLGGTVEDTVKALERGQSRDVSTGYFADAEPIAGIHDGRAYAAVQRDIKPDHILVLPEGGIGACSWADGCGAPRLNAACCDRCAAGETCEAEPMPDEIRRSDIIALRSIFNARKRSDTDRRMAVEAALASKFPDEMVSVVALFDRSVVYEMFDFDAGPQLLERTYELADDGAVTLGKSATRVRPETRFVPLTVNSAASTTQATTPDLPEDEETAPMADDQKANASPAADASAATTTPAPPPTGGRSIDDVIEAQQTAAAEVPVSPPVKPRTLDDILAEASPEMREVLNEGLRLHREQRDSLTAKIKANAANKISDEQLATMDLEMLRNIAALAKGEASYEGLGLRGNADDKRGVPEMAQMFANSSGKED